MIRFFSILLAVVSWSSFAGAADMIVFPAKNGNVIFNHKRHTEMLTDCRNCHNKAPGKIANFGKEYAHKTCKGCHEIRGTGPTKCGLCHRK